MKHYSAYQFALFRIAFGAMLCIQFLTWIGDAKELFSHAGLFADPTINGFSSTFPSVFLLSASPRFAECFVAVLALLSFGLMVGFYRRTLAALIYYGLLCLYHQNSLIPDIGLLVSGWLLLLRR